MRKYDSLFSLIIFAVSMTIFLACPVILWAATGDAKAGFNVPVISSIFGLIGIAAGWIGAVGKYGKLAKDSVEAYRAIMRTIVSAQSFIKMAPEGIKDMAVFKAFVADIDLASEELADVLEGIGRKEAAYWLRRLISESDVSALEKKLLEAKDPILTAVNNALKKATT